MNRYRSRYQTKEVHLTHPTKDNQVRIDKIPHIPMNCWLGNMGKSGKFMLRKGLVGVFEHDPEGPYLRLISQKVIVYSMHLHLCIT